MTRQPPTTSRPGRLTRPDGDGMMDVHAVAERLGTTVRHIRRLVQERRVPHDKIVGKLRFDRREIDEWVTTFAVPAGFDTSGRSPRAAVARRRTLTPSPDVAVARASRRSASSTAPTVLLRELGPTAFAVFEVLRHGSVVAGDHVVAHVSIRAVAADTGLAKNTVHRALRRLAALG